MDPYERLRRILVDDAYSHADLAIDSEVQRTATNAIDLLRLYIDSGKQLEQELAALRDAEGAARLLLILEETGLAIQAMAGRLISPANTNPEAPQ